MDLRHIPPDETDPADGADPGRESGPQMETISDAELLQRSADRPETFSMFYERHAYALLRFFARRTLDPEAAADLSSETFAEAFASRTRFRGEGSDGAAWLYGIANHQLARFRRRGAVDARARSKLGMPERDLSADDFDRIEQLIDLGPIRDRIAGALDALPEEQRDAVRLRVVEERSYPEVATTAGIGEAAARQRVSRGMRRLAAELEPHTHELAPELVIADGPSGPTNMEGNDR
jgi:RNA polymerase sigma-70 factor (ECF subfamily)